MKFQTVSLLFLVISITACSDIRSDPDSSPQTYIQILGIAQDAGFPQAGCEKENCALYWDGKVEARHATSFALMDAETKQSWLFEATPDIRHQLHTMKTRAPEHDFAGIFLTHAHIGHYSGLMQLGHEAMGADRIPVYAMPRMKTYLQTNGPWSQPVDYGNIMLMPLTADSTIRLTRNLSVTPILVPHRDEYSETVGYRIESPEKRMLFIPDINKWDVWDRSIVDEIARVDVALLDATFYDADELPGRDMSEIPHPFVEESVGLFNDLPDSEKTKITFIHFNHTNPLILDSPERRHIGDLGYKVAFEGMEIRL